MKGAHNPPVLHWPKLFEGQVWSASEFQAIGIGDGDYHGDGWGKGHTEYDGGNGRGPGRGDHYGDGRSSNEGEET